MPSTRTRCASPSHAAHDTPLAMPNRPMAVPMPSSPLEPRPSRARRAPWSPTLCLFKQAPTAHSRAHQHFPLTPPHRTATVENENCCQEGSRGAAQPRSSASRREVQADARNHPRSCRLSQSSELSTRRRLPASPSPTEAQVSRPRPPPCS
jgi:hypothetical protein